MIGGLHWAIAALAAMSNTDLVIVACCAVILAAYIRTAAPSIAGGDSGELVAEGCSLGTAHPPGYPLFTMMVYALKLVADALHVEVAYAVNISRYDIADIQIFDMPQFIALFLAAQYSQRLLRSSLVR